MKEITFTGAFGFTLYEETGIGSVLRKASVAKISGKVRCETPFVASRIDGRSMVVVRIQHGRLQDKFLDIDERNLRHEFPDAPDTPPSQLIV